MKKTISAILAAAMLLTTSAVFAEEATPIVEIHVSPSGADSNAATADAPIKSLTEAQKRVRSVNNGKTDVEVILHGGEYRVTQTLTMTSDDSGTEEHPVTWRAAEGENPVFKGSIKLDVNKFKKIESQSVYDRLHENAKDKVAVLDLKSQGVTSLATLFAGSYGSVSDGYNEIYVDNEAQTLARWPNNGYARIEKTVDASKGIFQVNDASAARWGTATDARTAGFYCWDWAYERTEVTAVDPETRYITINIKRTISQKIANAGARYFVYNLLEELDRPGEWYIDKDEMLLYYYPVYPITDSTMEMSVMQSPMIKMTGVEYVNISGIEFSQTTSDAIQMTQCNHITVSECNFNNIGKMAINAGNATTVDNVRNVTIENNVFSHIEMKAVYITGGDEETLTGSECVLRNNYFSDLGTKKRSYEGAIRADGVGTVIENNTICNAPHLAINVGGSLHIIRYNEIYDVCKESNDMGAIYTGRNAYRRGCEIYNNYIHDLVPSSGLAGLLCGVYWDDSQSGTEIHHNIFKNVPRSVFYNGGCDAYVHDNISIDSTLGFQFSYTANETVNQALFIAAIDYADAHPIYYEYFPELKEIDINYTKSHNNRVVDNLMVNAFGNSMTALSDPEWSTDPDKTNYARQNLSYNNVSVASVEEFSDFNDPENGDYTIKEDAKILDTLPGLAEIKLSEIGARIVSEGSVDNDEFKKIYPKNGEKNVTAAKLELKWEPAVYRTNYHVKVATDKEMTNVVFETTAKENYCVTERIESGGKTYYWQVTAESGAVTLGADEKSAYGAPYSFVTSRMDKLEQLVLSQNIKNAEAFLDRVTAGDGPGQCDEAILNEFRTLVNEAKIMNSKKYGSQNELDELNTRLENALSSIPKDVNKGYTGLDEWLSNEDSWQGQFTLEDNELVVTNGNCAMSNEFVTTYQIYKFKIKTDDFNNGYFTISFKIKDFGTPWGPSANDYSFYFKEKLIEFQRYAHGGGILETYENNGLMKSGEWADIEIAALDVEGGIQVYVKLNDEVIFNYFDDTGLISADGYLQFSVHSTAENVRVMPADSLPELDESIIMGGKTNYDDILYSTYGAADFENNVLKNELAKNEIAEINAVFNPEGIGQSIIIGNGDEYYEIGITADKIKLTGYSKNGNQILYVGKNNSIYAGAEVQIDVGAIRAEDGTRIVLYADGAKVIDCLDSYAGICGGELELSDNNEKGMTLR